VSEPTLYRLTCPNCEATLLLPPSEVSAAIMAGNYMASGHQGSTLHHVYIGGLQCPRCRADGPFIKQSDTGPDVPQSHT